MIGVDTSLIVRYLVGAPATQAKRATAVIDEADEVGISVIALLETAHVLRTQYGVARDVVVDTLVDLVNRENLTTLELSKFDVLEALITARSLTDAPIPNALIAAISRASGAVPVFTFDRGFGRLGTAVAAP